MAKVVEPGYLVHNQSQMYVVKLVRDHQWWIVHRIDLTANGRYIEHGPYPDAESAVTVALLMHDI